VRSDLTPPATGFDSMAARASYMKARRRRDCVFLPGMDVAAQFLEGRRRIAEVERARRYQDDAMQRTAVVVGLLMLVAPPLAVTLVWSMPRFSRAAQIALTIYGALVTIVMGAVLLAGLS
jgi:hypothetical protein